MNREVVEHEIEELDHQIRQASEALRTLKRKKKLLVSYLNPRASAAAEGGEDA